MQDERAVISRAIEFIRDAGIESVPVAVEKYLEKVEAVCKYCDDMDREESGQTTRIQGHDCIFINATHSVERQRFTILHELAHIVLGIKSNHTGHPTGNQFGSYQGRPQEEVLCDLFAAECLLPRSFFQQDVLESAVTLSDLQMLAEKYQASLTCTASRFVDHTDELCACVLSEAKTIRFARSSAGLRRVGGFVKIGSALPDKCVTSKLAISASILEESDRISAGVWLDGARFSDATLFEECICLGSWNQTLTLLSDIETAEGDTVSDIEEEEAALRELDGNLPWPGKSRRRR